jgi:preprotein translocase subunit SecG
MGHGETRTLTYILSAAFFVISAFFVYRSFYEMRIGSEDAKAPAAAKAD